MESPKGGRSVAAAAGMELVSVDSAQLADFAGKYLSEDEGVLVFEMKGAILTGNDSFRSCRSLTRSSGSRGSGPA